MNKYKFSVSKGQKKYSIIVPAASEEEAKERVHKEGYSILSMELANEESATKGTRFLFSVKDEGTKELKQGVIIGEDIFKVYLKLRKELKYDVLFLFSESDKDISQEEKVKIISSLREQYHIFITTAGNEPKPEETNVVKSSTEAEPLTDFYLKKELEETYKLIDFVLKKLENLLENAPVYDIDQEQKEKLNEIYTGIIKIKKSSNLSKLKQVGETALLKIGIIELKHLEKNKTKEAKDLLKETNKLLKQTGSTRQFVEKNKDIKLMFSNFLESLNDTFEKAKQKKEENKPQEIDKESYSYLKSVLLLNKYKAKLRINTLEILKNFHLFLFPFKANKEKLDNLMLKQKVIKQNISLLKAKKSGKMYSYTFIRKGYAKVVEQFIGVLFITRNYIFFTVFAYSLTFLFYVNLNHYSIINSQINFNGIFYFIIVIMFLGAINLSRGLITFFLNIVFLTFLFIFGVVNF